MKAIIGGGGLGGLTAAAALAQRGWDVTVYERQPELRASGSGIYIWENGLRTLEAIGGLAAVLQRPFRGLAFEQRDRDNRVIDPGVLPEAIRLITVPRSDLLLALKGAAERRGVKIRTNAEVTGATARGELFFADGSVEAADLAVGADGIWSKVREALALELVHDQTAEGAHRVIIPGTQSDLGHHGQDKYIENWNGSRRFLITPINDSEIYLALTCLKDDQRGKRLPIDKATWKDSFPHWAHLIDRIEGPITWGVYSTVKVRSWSAGRTALLGDAAHAQPPNLGQGGGMAMQMGLALAVHLEKAHDQRDIPDALLAWEAAERDLVDHCQKWSCLYGEVTYLPDEVRSLVVRSAMANPWIQTQFARAAASTPTGAIMPSADRVRAPALSDS